MLNHQEAGKGPAPHEVWLILGIIASNTAGVDLPQSSVLSLYTQCLAYNKKKNYNFQKELRESNLEIKQSMEIDLLAQTVETVKQEF